MIHFPSPDGSKEEIVGWRIYAIWQETRIKVEILKSARECKGGRYIWFFVEPLRAEYAIRPDWIPLGHLGLAPITYSH